MANDAVKKSDLYWYDNTHKIKHSINKELVERLSSGNNRFSSMESRGTTENLETTSTQGRFYPFIHIRDIGRVTQGE